MSESVAYANRYGSGLGGMCRHGIGLNSRCERCEQLVERRAHSETPTLLGSMYFSFRPEQLAADDVLRHWPKVVIKEPKSEVPDG